MKPRRPNVEKPQTRTAEADELYEANKWYYAEKRKTGGWKLARKIEQHGCGPKRIEALLTAYRNREK